MHHGAELRKDLANPMRVPGPDEVYLLGVSGFDHFAFEEMVIVELSIGAVMRVDIDVLGLVGDALFFGVL